MDIQVFRPFDEEVVFFPNVYMWHFNEPSAAMLHAALFPSTGLRVCCCGGCNISSLRKECVTPVWILVPLKKVREFF